MTDGLSHFLRPPLSSAPPAARRPPQPRHCASHATAYLPPSSAAGRAAQPQQGRRDGLGAKGARGGPRSHHPTRCLADLRCWPLRDSPRLTPHKAAQVRRTSRAAAACRPRPPHAAYVGEQRRREGAEGAELNSKSSTPSSSSPETQSLPGGSGGSFWRRRPLPRRDPQRAAAGRLCSSGGSPR